jgi:hypothetical protein
LDAETNIMHVIITLYLPQQTLKNRKITGLVVADQQPSPVAKPVLCLQQILCSPTHLRVSHIRKGNARLIRGRSSSASASNRAGSPGNAAGSRS